MKKLSIHLFILALVFAASSITSCKNKSDNSATTTTDTSMSSSAPVNISTNDELKKGVMDATKDYPTVKAEVMDSTINVTGEIKRSDWQKLNPTLNSLHPKRVNSAGLSIK